MNASFVRNFLDAVNLAMAQLPHEDIAAVGRVLLEAYDEDAWIYLAGNGGSAALASHFACDLEKTTAGKQPRAVTRRFRVVSLVDNIPGLTAWSNDESYDCAMAESMRSRARAGDVAIVISASGHSPTILQTLQAAREIGMTSVGLLGFDGGRAKSACDHAIHVCSPDYGVVESAHATLTHLVTRWLAGELAERHAQQTPVAKAS